ncbi:MULTISPECIES: hypothetical protein [unclassified Oceanobacillus]|uniref:hypothetical protein n=1 Tax=unclassified Oceanobacillus TaxID=2630292 RepID=UPI00300E33EB
MRVKEEDKIISVDKQKKMSPRERRILQRYGMRKQSGKVKSKARSINELYDQRYKEKFR